MAGLTCTLKTVIYWKTNFEQKVAKENFQSRNSPCSARLELSLWQMVESTETCCNLFILKFNCLRLSPPSFSWKKLVEIPLCSCVSPNSPLINQLGYSVNIVVVTIIFSFQSCYQLRNVVFWVWRDIWWYIKYFSIFFLFHGCLCTRAPDTKNVN